MHKLYEYVCDELKDLEKKAERGDLSVQEVEYADTLAHLKKNLMKADEMMEEDGEYSMMYYPMTSYAEDRDYSRRSYNNGRSYRGGSYAQRRDSMGRYSRRGYSMANDETINELHEVMNETQDEGIKSEMHQVGGVSDD